MFQVYLASVIFGLAIKLIIIKSISKCLILLLQSFSVPIAVKVHFFSILFFKLLAE